MANYVKHIAASMPLATLVLNSEEEVIFANNQFYNVFALKEEQVIGQNAASVIPSPDFLRVLTECKFTGSVINNTFKLDINQQVVWIKLQLVPVSQEGFYLVFMGNITQEVKNEKLLARSILEANTRNIEFEARTREIEKVNLLLTNQQGDLLRKTQELELLANTISIQIWYLTNPFTYGHVNRAHASFIGLKPEEIYNRKISEVFIKSEAYKYIEKYEKVFASGELLVEEDWFINHLQQPRLLRLRLNPHHDHRNKVDFVVCTAVDITEEKWLQDQLQESKKKIEKTYNSLLATQKEIDDSIRYAGSLQKAILPSEKKLSQLFKDHMVLMQPKNMVSGDFYWAESRDDFIQFALGDSTGHGVPGALMSVLGISVLNYVSDKTQNPDPAFVLEEARKLIKSYIANSDGHDGIEIGLLHFSIENNWFKYAGAGIQLYRIRNGTLKVYDALRQPAGYYYSKEKPFYTHQVDFQENDVFYFFSDGYADQFGGRYDKKFLPKRLKQLLVEISSWPVEDQKSELEKQFNLWKGENPQVDDVLVIGFKV